MVVGWDFSAHGACFCSLLDCDFAFFKSVNVCFRVDGVQLSPIALGESLTSKGVIAII